jgi:hypothetical protein
MDMTAYYAQLIGSRITGFRTEQDDDCGDPWPIFTVETETGEELNVAVSRDPEGNGGGFAFIELAVAPEVKR